MENSSDSLEVQQSSFTLHLESGLPKVYSLEDVSTDGGTNSSRSSTTYGDVTIICVLFGSMYWAVMIFLQFLL